jgi:type IV secretory pathway ATPase VirB11/archaellum biosynthesis ATPase
MKLEFNLMFIEKIIQVINSLIYYSQKYLIFYYYNLKIYEMISEKHGIMIIGDTLAGKTKSINALVLGRINKLNIITFHI